MAIKNTAKAVKDIETVEEVEAQELYQIVDAGIKQIVADHGIDIQKARYKAMRAIAWQAFVESIEAGDFDALVERASANVGNLPAGWELTAEAAAAKKATPAPKAAPAKPVAKPTAKPAAKAPAKRAAAKPAAPAEEAKPAARKRPVRRPAQAAAAPAETAQA